MILVIADDISGAAELAGAALRHGLSAEVQTVFDPTSTSDVICLDTDTRSCEPARAAQIAGTAASRAVTAHPEWIFKKCDSVLRGSVVAEARAVARAAGLSEIVILAANPSRRRVIREGRYFVDDVPLDKSIFAADPGHPRSSAQIDVLLGADLGDIRTPDAETAADVSGVARGLDARTLPVGALDLFEALLESRCPRREPAEPRTTRDLEHTRPEITKLLVCGSAASWHQRRATADARGIPALAMPHDGVAIARLLESARHVLVGIGDGEVTRGRTPRELTDSLAETVAQIGLATRIDHLLLEGGATAAAVVRALGWHRLAACSVAPAGVGVFTPLPADRKRVYIKPGSYDWPAGIWPDP